MPENTTENPWSPQDEGSHYPVTREWWTYETIFKTLKDNRTWNFMLIMSYNLEKPNCFFQYTLIDVTNDKLVYRKDIDDGIEKFTHKKNIVDLKYKKSTVTGLYPDYSLHLQDTEQGFLVDMNLHALSQPHWIAQDINNGDLPFGLNFYKYGYIPNSDCTGTMNINNQTLAFKGKAYIEHVWGDWSYQKPLSQIKNLRKTIRTYVNLGKWWLTHHSPTIPNRIAMTTENNIFGYDWIWGVFDNEWSVFYGNILFWLCQGPAFGVLTVTPDGKTFWEFCDIAYRYNKVHYVKEYDIYFASDIELDARLDDKKIHLRFYLTTTCHDYIDPFDHQGFYKAFILAEMPGKMEGTYQDNEKTVQLKGECKLMPLRQPSVLGHNAITLDILKPPKGVGLSFDVNSHYLKKRLQGQVRFIPKPKIVFRKKTIDEQDFTF